MIPSRWSSAIAILRRRQRWREEDLRLVHELREGGDPAHHPHAPDGAGDGDRGHDDEEPAFIVRWFLPQPPPTA